MSLDEPKKWASWRINRLLQILDHKAHGLTDPQIAEKMPISRATVSRELNSPQAAEIGRILRRRAEGLVWSLIEKQLTQIEGDQSLTSGQKLTYRGKIISTLASILPKQIEQKVTGDLQQKIEVEGIELRGLDEDAVGAIVQNFMDDEARKLRQSESTPLPGSEERPEDGLDTQG